MKKKVLIIEKIPKRKAFVDPVVISFIIERDLKEKLNRIAIEENASLGDIIRTAINVFIKEYSQYNTQNSEGRIEKAGG